MNKVIVLIILLLFASSYVKAYDNLLWGAMYAPYSAMQTYGMTGRVTGELKSAEAIISELELARQNGVSIIISVGENGECVHVYDSKYQYQAAIDHYDSILTSEVKSQLQSYVDDGTLRALRFYDEVHYCGGSDHCSGECTGIHYNLSYCDENPAA